MTPDIEQLAARVEALDGPSREVDGDIAVALGACQRRGDTLYHWSEGGSTNAIFHALPAFTASLDAAMTLVPEGWHTGAYHQGPSGQPHRWILRTIADGETFYRDKEATAATPALALCAAALRARAAQ